MFHRLKQLIIFSGDIIMLFAGFYLGFFLRYMELPGETFISLIRPMLFLFLLGTIILFIVGFYDLSRARNSIKYFQKIILSAAIWMVIAIIYFYLNPFSGGTPKTTLLLITICSFSLLGIWRMIYNRYLSANILKTPVVFIGWNEEIKEIADVIIKFPERGYVIAGFVTSEDIPYQLPKANDLESLLRNGTYPGLIVMAENTVHNTKVKNELYQALYRQVSIFPLAEFYENFFKRIPPFTFSEDWFITNLNEQTRKMYDRLRILLDLLFAGAMGVAFILIFPFVAILIKTTSPGPIFYKQKRVGRLGAEFNIYKLRTMKAIENSGGAEKDGPEYAKINDARITPVGSFLRKTRIDELPQFINVLRGEMAIIGPRPERPEFVEQLTGQMSFYSLRHLVKPGIAGWAQLQHSYYGSLEENLVKLQYDLYYIKNRGPFLDIVILLRTINVLARFMGR